MSIIIDAELGIIGPAASGIGPSYVVESLTGLKALTARPSAVLMQGRITSGDGGGGIFRWEAGSTTTPDDALTIQCTSGVTGRYKRVYNGPVQAEWFGIVGDGTVDDTSAWNALLAYAGPLGLEIQMRNGSIYRVTSELTLAGAKIKGDGSQTFRQYTSNRGMFIADQSGSEVHNVQCVYMPSRTAPTGMYKGFSAFQRICAVWTEASNVKFHGVRATNFFNVVCMRGPVVTATYPISAITLGSSTTITSTAHGIPLGGRGFLTGIVGPTALNNVEASIGVTDVNTLTIAINSTGYPSYVSGGTVNLYDFTSYADGISIRDCFADSCDFMVTGSQYQNGLIEGLRWTNQTNLTVPPHMIYIQSAGVGPNGLDGFVSRFTIRNCKGTNSGSISQPLLKFSNILDSTIEDCDTTDSYGILLSKAYRCKVIGYAYNASGGASGSEAIRFSDVGEDNEVLGGNLLVGGYGIRCTDNVLRTKVIGTKVIDDYSGGSSLATMFRTEDTCSMTLIGVSGHSKQNNSNYMIGTAGTSSITAFVSERTGAPGLIRVAAGTTARIQYDTNFIPAFIENSSNSIRNDGTLIESRIPVISKGFTSPVLFGDSVAGSHTYSSIQNLGAWERNGNYVTITVYVRLTSLDAAMAGNIFLNCLPFNVYAFTVNGSDNVAPVAKCSTAIAMANLPASGPFALYAEPIMGTTNVRFYYETSTATAISKTYLTTSNFGSTTRMAFQLTYKVA